MHNIAPVSTYLFIRRFKRRYEKARKIYNLLASQGSIELNINADAHGLLINTTIPNDELTTRFAIVMRPFLASDSPYYHQTALDFLRAEFPEMAPDSFYRDYQGLLERVAAGDFPFELNGKIVSASRVYDVISRGSFFDNESETRALIENIRDSPAGPFVWFQFHAYTANAYSLIASIGTLIATVERTSEYKRLRSETCPETPQCIYCKSTEGGFRSEEHFIPESLGNEDHFLPQGNVCDLCQNRLSCLDRDLVDSDVIAFLRTLYVNLTKKGEFQKANFQNLSAERTGPRHVRITLKDKSAELETLDAGDEFVHLTSSFVGRKPFRPVQLARSLYKIGLGAASLSVGHQAILNKKYNRARKFILHGNPYPNFLVMSKSFQPHAGWSINVTNNYGGTGIAITLFGCLFVLNLEKQPILENMGDLPAGVFEKYWLGDPDQDPT